jgi:hypothetical protein
MFLVGFIPYLVFNRLLAGNWWPNTFYAKQAEYAVMAQAPYIQRLFSLMSLPVIGAGIVLLPGFVYSIWWFWRRKNWAGLSAVLWWAGYTGLYALRLPVTYQHGRYLIPAMPVFFVIAGIGTARLLQKGVWQRKTLRLLRPVWQITLLIVWAAFYWLGATAYGSDVAIIETEMVRTAYWLKANTNPQDLIAAHDIGAIGYFSERKLVDLAGLVSPDVIPFIRDEQKLAAYMDQKKVRYLVTFPGWYPDLVKMGSEVYATDSRFAPEAGGENMAVYRWKPQ